MNDSEIQELIRDQFLAGDATFPLAADTDLLAEGICDSLGLVTLASALQQRVGGLRIADQEITRDNLGSPGSIGRFLRQKTGR